MGLQGMVGQFGPVHSLAVVLGGRKVAARRGIQTLLQCEQSCRVVMYDSEHYDIASIIGHHTHAGAFSPRGRQ